MGPRIPCLMILLSLYAFQVFAEDQGLWITEVRRSEPDAIEMVNVSGGSLDVSGWKIYAYDQESWPSPKSSLTLPSNVVLDAGELIVAFESGGPSSTSYRSYRFSSQWTWPEGGSGRMAILILDSEDAIADFFVGVGSSSEASAGDISAPREVPESEWSGASVDTDSGLPHVTFQRDDLDDSNDATDWSSGVDTIGVLDTLFTAALEVEEVLLEDVSPTSAEVVRYLVRFSQPVYGIDTGLNIATNDFAPVVATGALTGLEVEEVALVSLSEFRVSVSTGTGAGELRLDVLASGGLVSGVGEGLAGDFEIGPAYEIDRSTPTVAAAAISPDPAGLGSDVEITVNFSETMDQTLPLSAVANTAGNGMIAASAAGSGGDGAWLDATTYRVHLDRALVAVDDGTATVSLSGARDLLGLTMATDASHEFLIDAVAPVVGVDPLLSVDATPPLGGALVEADPAVQVAVTVAGQNFLAMVPGDGTWLVPDNTLSPLGSGVYDVEVIATDSAGNVGMDLTLNELTVNLGIIGVDSVVALDANPTALDVVRYAVTFASPVLGLETGTGGSFDDFDIGLIAGQLAGTQVAAVEATGPASYTVSVDTGTGDGAFRLLVLHTGGITNENGVPLAASYVTAPSYTIARDLVPPTVSSMVLNDVPGPTILFTIVFSEDVSGIETIPLLSDDFALTVVSGFVAGQVITAITQLGPDTFTVGALPGLGDGQLRLDVLSSGGIADDSGRGMAQDYTAGPVFDLNSFPPLLVQFSATPNTAGIGARPVLEFTFDDAMRATVPPEVSVATAANGLIAASAAGDGRDGAWLDGDTYRVSLDRDLTAADDGVALISIQGAQDDGGQEMVADTSRTLVIDGIQPVVTVESCVTEDFTPDVTGTIEDNPPSAAIQVTLAGVTYPAINHGNGAWTLPGALLPPLPAGNYPVAATATDLGGNTGTATGTVTIDPGHLAIVSADLLDASPTDKPVVRFRVQLSSAVSGVESFASGVGNDFAPIPGGAVTGAAVTAVSLLEPTVYVVETAIGEGDGMLGLSVLHSGGIRNPNGYAPAADLVLPASYITDHLKVQGPADALIEAVTGDVVELVVEASGGTPPYTYEWRFQPAPNVSVPVGENQPRLYINGAQFTDAGDYLCEVSDSYESQSSATTTVRVEASIPAAGVFGRLLLCLALVALGVLYVGWRRPLARR
ncbi:MAG: immunoglobulin domain-containing protein [Candidatus Hydrogenedentes bacterium]|nr:immunoglobulin domain-containing protein [Candidatus Hydrogenedentota bacterium]